MALAAVAQMSPYHFSRLFKRSTGLSPYQHPLRQRVERAKHLLADPWRRIADVSQELGFSAPAPFRHRLPHAGGDDAARIPAAARRAIKKWQDSAKTARICKTAPLCVDIMCLRSGRPLARAQRPAPGAVGHRGSLGVVPGSPGTRQLPMISDALFSPVRHVAPGHLGR
jgi:AraC-like DNA-binding protein